MHVSCNPQATVTTWDMKKETFGPQIRNICLRLQEKSSYQGNIDIYYLWLHS